jgi:cytochrome P450
MWIRFLCYIPEWFPGARFKHKAREWRKLRKKMTEDTFNVAKEQITLGTATPSLVSVAMQHINPAQDDIGQQEALVKAAAVTAYIASIETTVSAMESGILTLLMNPEIQAKAHRELDMVLGPGNLPSFSDEPLLPYIAAIVREIYRFQPVAPLGVPHLVTEDDIYEGYLIPKGSILMPNFWSIFHNEDDYPNPNQFNPARFLDADGKINPNVRDPTGIVFGFGRRICPGRHIAAASLWIAVASILACYTIEPPLDKQGKPVKPTGQWNPAQSLVNHPLPFKCRFVPRSKNVEMNLGLNKD